MAINLGSLFFGISANTSGLNAATQSVANFGRAAAQSAALVAGPLSGVASRISIITSAVMHFGPAWAGMMVGISGGTYVFVKAGAAIIDVAKKLEQVNQTLTAVSGDKTIAGGQLKYLADFADLSGAKITDIAKPFAQIQAAAAGTNLEGERTVKIFESIVMAGSKLGLSQQDIEGSLRAVQQMMSKGTIQAEELRGQLGDRLPGAMSIMADALGVTTMKLDTMLRKGEVGRSALVKFSEELSKRFNLKDFTGAWKDVDTIVAAENRLANATTKLLDTIDKMFGFSDAYKNLLKGLTSFLTDATSNLDSFTKYAAAAGGALVGLFAPAIISGALALGRAIGVMAIAMAGFTTATLANPIGALASLILRLGLAVTGGVAAFTLMDSVIKKTEQSMLTGLGPVKEYIKAQENLKSSVRSVTDAHIEQQMVFVQQVQNSLRQAEVEYENARNKANEYADAQIAAGEAAWMAGTIQAVVADSVQKYADKVVTLRAALVGAKADLEKLLGILDRQTKKETEDRKDPIKDLTTRQTLSIKNATDTVKELNEQYALMFRAPAAKEWGMVQLEINKSVENFRDQLTRSELPASKVVQLTEQYAAALRKVKEGEYALKTTTTYFQMIEGVFSKGLDDAVSQVVDNLVEGKDAFLDFGKVGQAVLKDLWKTMIQMAVMNPLKNFLFGTNYKTLGGIGEGGAGLGFLSSMFGGGSQFAGPVGQTSVVGPMPMLGGGIMSGSGPIPIRKYAGGGVARGAQAAIFGEGDVPEAYVPVPNGRIPVELSGGGGGNVEVHIHNAPGTTSSVQSSRGDKGGQRIDVWIKQAARDAVVGDLMSGGAVAQTMESRYGLNRTRGMPS